MCTRVIAADFRVFCIQAQDGANVYAVVKCRTKVMQSVRFPPLSVLTEYLQHPSSRRSGKAAAPTRSPAAVPSPDVA